MGWLKLLYNRCYGLLFKDRVERDMDEEMRFHIRMRTNENIGRGMNQQEAKRDAMKRFGNFDRIKEACRDVKGGGVLEVILQDLRYGARMLIKKPGFTLIAVLTLALGTSANTALFGVADKLLFKSLPVRDPQRLVLINSVSVSPHFVSNIFSHPDYVDYRNQNEVLSDLGAFTTTMLGLQADDQVERLSGEIVSENYFDLLGIKPELGRLFGPQENQAADLNLVAVISDGLWRRRFGSDPAAIGKTIILDDAVFNVIGVAPRGFSGMLVERSADIWVPLITETQLQPQSKRLTQRGTKWLRLIGRLKDEVSPEQAQAELDVLVQQLKQYYQPQSPQAAKLPFSEQHISLEPGGKGISGLRKEFSRPLLLLLGIVGLVLLIACANVANLLLARAVARRKEIAVRLALGASRSRLIRQLLTESLLLATAGGAMGLLLVPWITGLLLRFQTTLKSAHTPLSDSIDYRVLGFTAAVTVVCGIAFGLVPALQSSKTDVVSVLKQESGTRYGHPRRFSLRAVLVVAQVALAFVVLIGAGLFIKSLHKLFLIDPGFKTENVLLVPVELDPKKYNQVTGREFQQEAIEHVRALPGVESASISEVVPLSGWVYTSTVFIEGYTPQPDEVMAVDGNFVGPGYHETMGIPIVQGRGFSEQDRKGAPGVVIINEEMARRFFDGEAAVGKRLKLGTNDPYLEIIGVSRDIKYRQLTEEPMAHFDLPALQNRYNSYTTLTVRGAGAAENLLPIVTQELQELEPSLTFNDVRTMAEQLSDSIATARMAATLTGLFGALALLLATIGLYGVMTYTISQRTREIGIRKALGAQTSDVLKLVMRQGLALLVVGLVIGSALALAMTRAIASQLYGMSATDPATFAAIALLLTTVALLACLIPARRAAKVDPMIALRYE